MANFPVASLTDLPQDHLPVAVQLVLADSVNQALTPDQWLLLFRNADAFGGPINPYRIPPDAAGLWRVGSTTISEITSRGSVTTDVFAVSGVKIVHLDACIVEAREADTW
ncbi:hypothetical protein F2Q70_00000494 [Brassica cretica]|uniref:Uncharacterized protein n=1 Tax=Brassica cretica TaxID=69181 RepID=A0A8S9IJP7_BRACR|nr:hypothetical protein F2Q70_00000494 [Brassica cretica]